MASYEKRTKQYRNGRKRIQILVKCAKCNKERWILKEYIKIKRANLCHKCACENISILTINKFLYYNYEKF